jgi:unsaturated rhamnogalacturonyl hydrolase
MMTKNPVKPGLFLLLAAIVVPAAGAEPAARYDGATPLEWSVRMADSETARRGDNLAWKQGGRAKWDYTAGLFTLSLLKLNERQPTPAYVEFATNAIGSFITPDGKIQGYTVTEHNIDNLNAGKTVLALWQLTKEDRYQKAAALLRSQLNTHPRTSENGFWHKERYTNQMWLDGLYMGAPFYAEYTKLFNGPAADYDDVALQFRLVEKHLYDPATGLFYHGWDEKRTQGWANKTTGTSSNFWGRGMGWYSMALVDVLDFLPKNHPARKNLIAQIRKTSAGIVKWQDKESGLWWQVLDQGGREGNYLEATASCMFVYSMAKAVNQGYLSRDYIPAIQKGYSGIINRLIKKNGEKISLTQCCSVAGLGFGRDGSYAYYVHEPIVENDLKGVGPFILAGIELDRLSGADVSGTGKKVSATSAKNGDSFKWDWRKQSEILARIQPPVFRHRDYPITRFGAAAGGEADASDAIRSAIDRCAGAGGGRVIVPAGVFLTGAIQLKSGVNLHLEKGATLRFKTDPKAYLPAVFTRFEGMECWNYSPLIYAFEQKNIAVTGEGTLDGQADDSNWWGWKGNRSRDAERPPATQTAARQRLAKMVTDNTPVDQRRFGDGDNLRPGFIEPHRCKNVLIEGVRIRRSPMWEIHPLLSTNVIVRGVEIVSHGPNNDGCDPESSRGVLIENCLFDTGDDCIAIKSGRNNDGRRVGIASENLVIRGCTMKDGHGGVTIGSEISGGCRNVFVEDCEMDSPHLERVLRFKSNAVRGGLVENVFMRNVSVGRVADAALQIDFVYEEGTNGIHKPVVRNVIMQNVTVRETPRVLNVVGIPAGEINGVRILNSTFRNVKSDDVVRQATGVKLVNCVVERSQAGEKPTGNP